MQSSRLSYSASHDAKVPVATNAISLAIEGMSCASCVSRIEKAVRAVPGVQHASVNLATNRADVQFAGPATTDAVAAAIRKAGYTPSVDAPSEEGGHSGHMHHDEAIGSLKKSLIEAASLTVPLVLMAMGPDLFPRFGIFVYERIGLDLWHMLEWALASLVLFGPGMRFFRSGIPALLRGAPEMNALVALGTFAAWAYSSVATFAPQLFPAGTAQVYFESAGVIVTLILLGRLLEARAKGAAGDAIKHLLGLRPETAQVIRNGSPVEVKLATVVPGELVLIRPGERVPLDGVVTDGASFVDQSMLTGEPEPVRKSIDDEVVGGTINTSGSLTVKVTKVGADTVLSRIIKMVEQAQGAKLPIQALVDRVTGWFVPAVIAIAALTFIVWFFFGPQPALGFALVNMVAVLIIACPCAMGLATPVSIMVATGRAAQLGILLRQGAALEALRDVGVIAFDKTGTLTKGHPELTDFFVAPGFEEADVLTLAASVEIKSEHPISRAIIAAAKARGLTLQKAEAFEAALGFGVTANIGAKKIALGADRFMAKLGIDAAFFAADAERMAKDGKSPLFIAVDGRLAGILAVADPIKPSAAHAIAALKAQGLTCAMVSGDKQATAEAIARQLGIDHVVAEVLPEGKVTAVESLRKGGKTLAFVGDGINDAPALAAADVGIAVGTGTDIAIESADVVLMSGELDAVVSAVALSRATLRNIGQNLFWAFGYNVVLIPVAAGVLYPALHILLSPMLAAGAMAFSSVFVVTNALRLKRFKPAAQLIGRA